MISLAWVENRGVKRDQWSAVLVAGVGEVAVLA